VLRAFRFSRQRDSVTINAFPEKIFLLVDLDVTPHCKQYLKPYFNRPYFKYQSGRKATFRMAKLRYLIHSRPSSLPYSLALCTACSLFLNANIPDALAQSESIAPISALPDAPVSTRAASPQTKKTAATKSAVKAASGKKGVLRKSAPVIKTTTLKTSGASRVAGNRAASLYAIVPEKSSYSRTAIATFGSSEITSRATEAGAAVETTNEPASDLVPRVEVAVRPALSRETAAPGNAAQTAPEYSAPAASPSPESTVESAPESTIQSTPSAAPDAVRYAAATPENQADETSSGSGAPVTGTFQIPAATSTAPTTPATATESAGQPATAASTPAAASGDATTPKTDQPAKLFAPRISYDRGTVIAEGDATTPVRLESPQARIIAQKVVLDTVAKTVKAEGSVRVEREVNARRFNAFQPSNMRSSKYKEEVVTETLQGENFEYNFETKQGTLGKTRVRLESFNITAEQLVINGQRYIARNVIIRPGGLSDEEIKIYGTPPFNLRAKEVIVDRSQTAPPRDVAGDTAQSDIANQGTLGPRTEVHGASLYFRNLRLLPVPSALLRRSGGQREEATYQLTPRVYFNDADGVLVTARLEFPLIRPAVTEKSSAKPLSLNLISDVGVSTRIGFRGGVEVQADSKLGRLSLGARINDVISQQLTDRIELDRLPELQYSSPPLKLFGLPGSRAAGLVFNLIAGDYRENFTNENRSVEDSKLQGQIRFTTLLGKTEGPYFELFARSAHYGDHPENLNTQGFEVGYIGRLGSRLNGQVSFRAQNVDGSTPFRFDRVEIRREIRTTFDILLTPRWIIPIDLRYDVDQKSLRDKTFGLLRNYKTFAYGLKYQSSRHELRLEIRQGF
jgi:hypothetical protein